MRLPIISGYIERKRNEAESELEGIREFFSKENNPSSHYDKGRKILESYGDEVSLIDLMKMKRQLDRKYFLWSDSFFPGSGENLEKFHNLSEEEKAERAKDQMQRKRTRKLESILEQWVKNAEPILADIIEKNSKEVAGLEYYDHFAGGGSFAGESVYKRVEEKNGKLYTRSFSSYGDYGLDKATGEEIASGVLEKLLPDPDGDGVTYLTEWEKGDEESVENETVNVFDISKGIDKVKTGRLVPHRETEVLYKKRKELVEEIEKRTGRNLKEEVMSNKKKDE